MSNSKLIHWNCCRQTFEVLIWHSINRQLSPGKTEEFALGRVNQIVCPKCGRSLQSPWPVLFNDMDKGIMVQAGDDPFSDEPDLEVGGAMLKVEDPIVAARVLVALDTSELPQQLMARDPALKERDANAEAFRILYRELAGHPK
ncbi:MAG TPA: CpXC domain-containing protein [Candidatus Sulfotelmatobacter sp.]|nr:CpXC domain-containing protein [Candidatus Sulfotelmatobacter sp.]